VNLLLVFQILGWLVAGVGAFQLLPLAMALAYGEPGLPYLASAAAALVYGLTAALTVSPVDRRLRVRDGFLVVVARWLLASAFGALPYVTTGTLHWADALFESVAGFTTTGSTVLVAIEDTPHALLLWRSLTQWLGGMGIIVFAIAVLPLLGIGGMQLFRAEMPGPVTDKLTPRIADTARRLWMLYVGFTFAAFALLLASGLGPFDALCHALTTLATGGFSTRSASLGAFGPAAQWVVIAFMLLAGTNFSLHYRLLASRVRAVAGDAELHLYLGIVGLATLAVLWQLDRGADEPALREALFQVVSLVTTTGFATADYEAWPAFTQFLVLHLLLVGGMAGSTAGGMKTLRLLLGLRALRVFVWRLTHPHAVRRVHYAGRAVEDDVVGGVAIFFVAYLAIAALAGGVIAAFGYDVTTAMSAAFTAIGNVGPGLGEVGPNDHFAHFPTAVKSVLFFFNDTATTEIYTVLVILEPHFWRR
jgi:trk system potassium uptake protein TrkH